jgi:hypothetical protein
MRSAPTCRAKRNGHGSSMRRYPRSAGRRPGLRRRDGRDLCADHPIHERGLGSRHAREPEGSLHGFQALPSAHEEPWRGPVIHVTSNECVRPSRVLTCRARRPPNRSRRDPRRREKQPPASPHNHSPRVAESSGVRSASPCVWRSPEPPQMRHLPRQRPARKETRWRRPQLSPWNRSRSL